MHNIIVPHPYEDIQHAFQVESACNTVISRRQLSYEKGYITHNKPYLIVYSKYGFCSLYTILLLMNKVYYTQRCEPDITIALNLPQVICHFFFSKKLEFNVFYSKPLNVFIYKIEIPLFPGYIPINCRGRYNLSIGHTNNCQYQIPENEMWKYILQNHHEKTEANEMKMHKCWKRLSIDLAKKIIKYCKVTLRIQKFPTFLQFDGFHRKNLVEKKKIEYTRFVDISCGRYIRIKIPDDVDLRIPLAGEITTNRIIILDRYYTYSNSCYYVNTGVPLKKFREGEPIDEIRLYFKKENKYSKFYKAADLKCSQKLPLGIYCLDLPQKVNLTGSKVDDANVFIDFRTGPGDTYDYKAKRTIGMHCEHYEIFAQVQDFYQVNEKTGVILQKEHKAVGTYYSGH